MRGKPSNLTSISKIFNLYSQPYKSNDQNYRNLIKFQFFSSINGPNDKGYFKKTNFNDSNDKKHDKDDNFMGKNGRNSSGTHHKYRGSRRGDFNSNDRFNGGLSGNDEGKKVPRPSISELLDRPLKGNEGIDKEGSEFLEKFKLGGSSVGNEGQGTGEGVGPGEAKQVFSGENDEVEQPPEDADVIFKKMKQTGLIPNAVAMLDGLCKDGLIQEAMKLFGLMREKGTMPEVVVYTAVVEGFVKARKLDDAVRIFRKMKSNGIVPNAFSYGVLVRGLYKGKRLDDAVDLCLELLEAGHSPNVATFTGLVQEFCVEKGAEEARKVIGALQQKGFLLDEKAVRNYLDKTGPTSPMVWEAIFGPKKTTQKIS